MDWASTFWRPSTDIKLQHKAKTEVQRSLFYIRSGSVTEGINNPHCCCSIAQLYLTLCDPMDCSTAGFPVLHHLPKLAQTHVHSINDVIQSFHPLSPSSPPAFNLFQRVSSSHQVASVGVSASAPVLPMNIQGWVPLGLTGLISLQSKGLSRVFSNITVLKHQFFTAQPSLRSNSHIHTWPLEKPQLWLYGPL